MTMLQTYIDPWGSLRCPVSGKHVPPVVDSDQQTGKLATHWLLEPRPVQASVEDAVESIPLARSWYQSIAAGGVTTITRIITRTTILTVPETRQQTATLAESM